MLRAITFGVMRKRPRWEVFVSKITGNNWLLIELNQQMSCLRCASLFQLTPAVVHDLPRGTGIFGFVKFFVVGTYLNLYDYCKNEPLARFRYIFNVFFMAAFAGAPRRNQYEDHIIFIDSSCP